MSAGRPDGIKFLRDVRDFLLANGPTEMARQFAEGLAGVERGAGSVSLDRAFGVDRSWAARERRRDRDAAILRFHRAYFATDQAKPAALATVAEIAAFVGARAQRRDAAPAQDRERDALLEEIALLGGGMVRWRTVYDLVSASLPREKRSVQRLHHFPLHDTAVQLVRATRSRP